MKSEFILSFKHISSGEMLYFYVNDFKRLEKEWLITYGNSSKTIWRAAVELMGTVSEAYVSKQKEKVFYPFEFNTALL